MNFLLVLKFASVCLQLYQRETDRTVKQPNLHIFIRNKTEEFTDSVLRFYILFTES